MPYDPAIQFLGISLDKTIIQKDTCISMFIAALFAIAKTWKQAKCPLTHEWMKKIQYIESQAEKLGLDFEEHERLCRF